MNTVDNRSPMYPASDGERIAEHTLQFEWISTLWVNLSMLFASRDDVFVAADNLIYPVEGDNRTREAPDAYVALGRPRGHRDNFRVWEEGGLFPQVVFEVRPPAASSDVMARKFDFYDRYGAVEYYDYDPFENRLTAHGRATGGRLVRLAPSVQFVSPLLGIRFETGPEQLAIYHPSGEPFRTFSEWIRVTDSRRAAEEARRAAEAERQRADAMQQELARALAMFRAAGLDPDAPAPG